MLCDDTDVTEDFLQSTMASVLWAAYSMDDNVSFSTDVY